MFEGDTVGAALRAVKAHRHTAHPEARKAPAPANGAEPLVGEPLELELEPLEAERRPADPNPELLEENRPAEPERRGWRDRMWTTIGGKRDRADKTGAEVTPAGDRKPAKPKRARGKRVSTANAISTLYGGGGYLLVRTGVDRPVGRCLQFQAPAAGEVLEELTRDTFLDVPLQYLAQRMDAAEKAGALLGLPLLVFLYERGSDELRAGILDPLLRQALEAQLVAMVPVVKKARKKEAETAAAIAELGLLGPEGSPSGDPVGDILRMIFTDPEPAPANATAAP